jgi:hypothetical protein
LDPKKPNVHVEYLRKREFNLLHVRFRANECACKIETFRKRAFLAN